VYPILFHLPEWFPLLGGEAITSFGVMMFLSFLTGGYVVRSEMERTGQDPEIAWDLLFVAVIGGVVGAKIYYMLLNYPRLVADPMGMILSRGGMVWYGGFLLAGPLLVWKTRSLKLNTGTIADFGAPALALAYAVGRLGCFLVGDDYGRPTAAWYGIAFPNGTPPTRVDILERQFGVVVDPALIEQFGQIVPVHPTQLYEVGMSLIIFAFLWRIRVHKHKPGWLFMIWTSLAGAERFLVEIFRVKDDRFFGVLTVAQLISVALIVIGFLWMTKLTNRKSART